MSRGICPLGVPSGPCLFIRRRQVPRPSAAPTQWRKCSLHLSIGCISQPPPPPQRILVQDSDRSRSPCIEASHQHANINTRKAIRPIHTGMIWSTQFIPVYYFFFIFYVSNFDLEYHLCARCLARRPDCRVQRDASLHQGLSHTRASGSSQLRRVRNHSVLLWRIPSPWVSCKE